MEKLAIVGGGFSFAAELSLASACSFRDMLLGEQLVSLPK